MPAKETQKQPSPITTRMFWTWDHSTEWALNKPGAQTMGASNHYGRTTEVFVQDYTNLLQWCGRHGIDAVVVWGLLRDTHGGLDSVKRLCEVAAKEGVRLLGGVGMNAYGGVYYEGGSPYSLERHLQKYPEMYAVDPAGDRMVFDFGTSGPKAAHHACPSRRENQEFMAESLRWLFETLPLGGVQIETGDTGVCRCSQCTDRRQYPVSVLSWEDMALMYPLAAEAIRSVAPEAWVVCETYSHPEPYFGPDPAPGFGEGKPEWADDCLAQFPEGVYVQWVCDQFVSPQCRRKWTNAGTVANSRHHHVMRSHFGTYWGRFRGELALDWIAEMAQLSMSSGFDGLSLWGEVSPFHAGAELNYLALEHFGSEANPEAQLEVFLREVAAPLLGGEAEAFDYLRYARLLEDPGRIPEALDDIRCRCVHLSLETTRRWTWLANQLASFIYPEPQA